MMTKRSNHMPTFTHRATARMTQTLVRAFLDQSTCGATTLQQTITQNAHAYGPKGRFMNTNCS